MNSFALTDVGMLRNSNQDSIFVSDEKIGALPNLYIVADGMGGENAGDYASKRCIEVVLDEIKKSKSSKPVEILDQAIQAANTIIYHEAKADALKKGMGTTIVAATIIDGHLLVANVGDSRLYVSFNSQLTQISKDHSYVAELVRDGQLEKEQARTDERKNMITRAIGAKNTVKVDYFDVSLTGNELVLLCSDGLTNMVEDGVIESILEVTDSLENKAKGLLQLSNDNGGKDNVSIILVETF